MQFCDFAACEKNLEAEADRLEGMEYITETERDALDISVLKKLFCGDFYKKISKAGKILREQRFLSRLAVGEIIPEIAEKYMQRHPENGFENIDIQWASRVLAEHRRMKAE